jgi:DNA sulfur modification protein DndD
VRLKKVDIKNYRPFRDVEVELTETDGHIHIIEGPQGAGKTSFHRAIQWALYGDTAAPNYRTHWNDLAAERDEPMRVKLLFQHQNNSVIIIRELDLNSVNHTGEKINDSLTVLIGGENQFTGRRGQDWVYDTLPESLSGFFFLDGEDIQRRVMEGEEIKEDIETVLKHTAILNARDDLQKLIDDRYKKRQRKLEDQIEERADLAEKIEQKKQNNRILRDKKSSKEREKNSALERVHDARQSLEERNEEASSRLEKLEEDKIHLIEKQLELRGELKDAWLKMPSTMLSDEIRTQRRDFDVELTEIEADLDESNHKKAIRELFERSDDGVCPLCDSSISQDITPDHETHETSAAREVLEKRRVEIRDKNSALEDIKFVQRQPASIEEELNDTREEIEEIEEERENLLNELSGADTTDKGDLEDSISNLEDEINGFESNISDYEGDIEENEREIRKLKSKKRGMAGPPELDELELKIDAAQEAKKALRGVREEHIRRKRAKIKQHMNSIFDTVSQSEFIRGRYDEIDFQGDADSADEYVLQLVKQNGEAKDMTNRPPSAGETQLTALSFIFGLNKYANYSTTIVFDTVAGRLDLDNSHARGAFFESLDESIVLLVTDAELAKLEQAMKGSIGVHYSLHPAEEAGRRYSEMREVE